MSSSRYYRQFLFFLQNIRLIGRQKDVNALKEAFKNLGVIKKQKECPLCFLDLDHITTTYLAHLKVDHLFH